jgi:Uma2 family endonuclease
MILPTANLRDVRYPETDGDMGESDLHRWWMHRLIERLQYHFQGQPVYVTGNLMLYYEEGLPQRSLSPDVFVVTDCEPRRRVTFKTWEEGKVPDFVLEIASESTYREDARSKLQLYERIGVAEYFIYDPEGAWLQPALQGYRLVKDAYQPLNGNAERGVLSRRLGIRLALEHGQLVMTDSATGQPLLSGDEQAAALKAELARVKGKPTQRKKRPPRGKSRP